jgi:predicted SnoaL-like aldol condensation-catalyzing enzyme
MADPQKNKQTVIAYYNMAFNDRKPAEAAQKVRRASLHPAQPPGR